ncbi:hypothetical protein DCAR_0626289 [Daucus carota subsp. sativus]|uniref:Uncharacterized protein n=1 Tax=Daucus carota subsp. sativus TaxID=79200 RepID=A0A161YHA3_DAUCS|nr:PREDICTED: protein NETWORKED 4B-like [Daucus carota subsp. sativus]WOH06860.1 hypothetical protein DCAR_0626289 [Daucus carota subsp. sativus]
MKGLIPYSRGLDSHIRPENPKWLAENIEEVDKILEEIRRLTEDEYFEVTDAEGCHQQKPQLVAHATRIGDMYKLLAERYNHLTEEVRLQISSPVNMKNSAIIDSGSQRMSPLQTPDQKFISPRSEQDGDSKMYPGLFSGSPDSSSKEASEYSTSSDSESESFYSTTNKDTVSPMSIMSKVPASKFVEQTESQGTEVMVQKVKEEYVDGTANVRESEDSDMLSGRLAAYEDELVIAREKLQFLENENARLEGELKTQQSVTVLTDISNAQLHAQQSEQMQDAKLEMEKRKVLELQYQVAELQCQIDDSKGYVELLMQELKMYREKLRGSEEEIEKLKKEHCDKVSEATLQFQIQLESAYKNIGLLTANLNLEHDQVVELEEKILGYAADKLQHDKEITALKLELSDAHKNFSEAKELLQSDLSGLLEQNTKLNAIVEDFEAQIISLEKEIYRCKFENVEMQALHDAQVIDLQVDIENLKAEVKDKSEQVEAVNKNLDMLILNYDVLMENKDVKVENLEAEVKDKGEQVKALNKNLDMLTLNYDVLMENKDVKVENLNAELSSKNDEIREMKNHLNQLQLENVEMVAESKRGRKLADELNEKVVELQNEVDRQLAMISDQAEKKREAIRQLCFSVEHYRNRYQELRQAFLAR